MQGDRARVHAAGRRQEHPHRRLRLLLEEAAERCRRRHRLGEAVRYLENRIDPATRNGPARLLVRALGQAPEHVAEQPVAAVDGAVEGGATHGEVERELLHVDRGFA
jgi:hypothetical protein